MGAYKLTGHIFWTDTLQPDIAAPNASTTEPAGHTPSGAQPAQRRRVTQWRTEPIYIENGIVTTSPQLSAHTEISGWALPGLCDVHCHIGLVASGKADRATTLQQAQADAASGVLLVRDCGSPQDTSFVDAEQNVPRIVRCGHHLAKPKRYLRYYGRELTSDTQLPKAMVEEARRGSGWVKLVGDWIDRSEGAESTLRPLWSRAALREGVAGVHELGGRVTVHTFSHAALDDLLDAGVDCIEHGTGMDEDHMDEVIKRGMPVTPTVLQVDRFDDFAAQAGTKYPVYAQEMSQMYARREEHFARAWDAGVHFLPGTDAGGYQKHGVLPSELQAWLRFGATPAEVIDCATWRVREYLNQPGLEEGAPADVVVYAEDPTAPPSRDNPLGGLAQLSHPTVVLREGVSIPPHVRRHEV